MTPLRQSTEAKLEKAAVSLTQAIVGLLLLITGLAGGAWSLEHAKDGHADHVVIYICVGLAIFGALILPGIFTVVQPVVVFFFPNGLPMLGGRRVGDPPKE